MTIKQKHLNHARHNVEACDFLKGTNKFNDWVITTAFYAVIHFAKYELFPKKYPNATGDMKQFNDFNQYCKIFDRFSTNKHKILSELVEDHWPEDIFFAFQKLKDLCWTARYTDYQHSKNVADDCYECLLNIREYCETGN